MEKRDLTTTHTVAIMQPNPDGTSRVRRIYGFPSEDRADAFARALEAEMDGSGRRDDLQVHTLAV